jgi:hypothetical protein
MHSLLSKRLLLIMEPLIDFADLLKGLQCLPEREKIILVALVNAHGSRENGNRARLERLVAEAVIAAAREHHSAPARKF